MASEGLIPEARRLWGVGCGALGQASIHADQYNAWEKEIHFGPFKNDNDKHDDYHGRDNSNVKFTNRNRVPII